MKKLLLVTSIATFISVAGSASGSELLTNGDFETGDLTG